MNKLDGPIFNEEDDGTDEITKKKKKKRKSNYKVFLENIGI